VCSLIERYFGTIERRWISKLPGWCRCSIAGRPTDFQETLSKLLQKEELLTLEEFVDYFQNTILPEYCGSPDTETSIPELPGWDLTFDSMSPIQRYENLEKARTISLVNLKCSPILIGSLRSEPGFFPAYCAFFNMST